MIKFMDYGFDPIRLCTIRRTGKLKIVKPQVKCTELGTTKTNGFNGFLGNTEVKFVFWICGSCADEICGAPVIENLGIGVGRRRGERHSSGLFAFSFARERQIGRGFGQLLVLELL